MIVLDALDTNQDTAFFDKPAWPMPTWNSFHVVYTFAGYGSDPGAAIGGDPDLGYPSVYLQDGSYATQFGAAFTNADFVAVDFEHWPVDQGECPHVSEIVPPYNSLDNIHQTSLDVVPQVTNRYAFYNWGPDNNTTDEGNLCYEPLISQDQQFGNVSNYLQWTGYPGGESTPKVDLLDHIQQKGRETAKYLTLQYFFNTSFMYVDTGGPGGVTIPEATWREILQWVFHFHSGLSLWYHKASSGYSISWFDAAIQANVDAIQEEYDKLWANMIVGSIA